MALNAEQLTWKTNGDRRLGYFLCSAIVADRPIAESPMNSRSFSCWETAGRNNTRLFASNLPAGSESLKLGSRMVCIILFWMWELTVIIVGVSAGRMQRDQSNSEWAVARVKW